MLNNTRLSRKLIVMVATATIGIVAVAFVGLTALRAELLADRKEKLQQLVELADQSLDRDYHASLKAGLTEEQAKEHGKALLASLHFGKEDYFYALDMNGVLVVHPSPKFVNTSVMDSVDVDGVHYGRQQLDLIKDGVGSGFVSFSFPRGGVGKPLPKIVYVEGFKPYDWAVAGGIYIDDIDDIFLARLKHIGLVIAATLGLVLGMSVTIGRSITVPIAALTSAMRRLAMGETTTAVPATGRGDEVGDMAKSVQVFKDAMIESVRLREEQVLLEQRAEVEKKQLMAQMADSFERSVSASLSALSHSATEMCSMSQSMSATAEGASRQATIVSSAAEEASTNVQAVAAATEELSHSITEIGTQVMRATDVAGRAVDEASRTNGTAQGLSSAAARIEDIIQLISAIAAQTNLLALNATIEAARAGEAGKGFAVVAEEVKSLATQTARATGEISSQVTAMQTATQDVVDAIDGIGRTISSINQISTVIAAAVEEQDAATREIARNVSQASVGTNQVSSNIGGVNDAAGQTGEAAGNVRIAAEDVSQQAEILHANVQRFLAEIRAA